MADYCRDCVAALWGDQDGRNDLTHVDEGGLWWVLCEGCGFHAFTPEGARLCQRPQTDFAGTDEATSAFVGEALRGEPCAACMAAADGGEP